MNAFVAGATGYTGSSVVEVLRQRQIDTVAHIRPGSSKLESCREHFSGLGAEVDTTPWQSERLRERLAELRPDLVFCCIGTTRKRKRQSDNPEENTYEAVDYGLTAMLAQACVDAEIAPRFVYISAAGTSEGSMSSYVRARWKAEQFIKDSGLPYTLARPSFIAGDREEDRPGEEIGAKIGDFFLNVAGAVGFEEFRDRYRSITGEELATALVEASLSDEYENRTIDGVLLQELSD